MNNFKIVVRSLTNSFPEFVNGDFESWVNNNTPSKWAVNSPLMGEPGGGFAEKVVHESGFACKLENYDPTPPNTSVSIIQSIRHPTFLPQIITPGTSNIIKITFEYKGNDLAVGARIYQPGNPAYYPLGGDYHIPSAINWTEHSAFVRIPASWTWSAGTVFFWFAISVEGSIAYVDNITVKVLNPAGGQDIKKILKINTLKRRIEDDLFIFKSDDLNFEVINCIPDYTHFYPYNFISQRGQIFRLDITTPNAKEYMLFVNSSNCKRVLNKDIDKIQVTGYELPALLKDKGWYAGELVWNPDNKKFENKFGTGGEELFVYLRKLLKNIEFDDFTGNIPDYWIPICAITSQYTAGNNDNWVRIQTETSGWTSGLKQEIESWQFDNIEFTFRVFGYSTHINQTWKVAVRDITDNVELNSFIVDTFPHHPQNINVSFTATQGHKIRFYVYKNWDGLPNEDLYMSWMKVPYTQNDILGLLLEDLKSKVTEHNIPINSEDIELNCNLEMGITTNTLFSELEDNGYFLYDWRKKNDGYVYLLLREPLAYNESNIYIGRINQDGKSISLGNPLYVPFLEENIHLICLDKSMDKYKWYFIIDTDIVAEYIFDVGNLNSVFNDWIYEMNFLIIEQYIFKFGNKENFYIRMNDYNMGAGWEQMRYFIPQESNLISGSRELSGGAGGSIMVEWAYSTQLYYTSNFEIDKFQYDWIDKPISTILKDLCVCHNAKTFFSYNFTTGKMILNVLKRESNPKNAITIPDRLIEEIRKEIKEVKLPSVNTELVKDGIRRQFIEAFYRENYGDGVRNHPMKLKNFGNSFDNMDLNSCVKHSFTFARLNPVPINLIEETFDNKDMTIESME